MHCLHIFLFCISLMLWCLVITACEQNYNVIKHCCSYVVIQTFAVLVKAVRFSRCKQQVLYVLKISMLNITAVLIKRLT